MEMDFNLIQQLIGTVGFPIFVAVWMLVKDTKEKEAIRTAISQNTNAITQLTAVIDTLKNRE